MTTQMTPLATTTSPGLDDPRATRDLDVDRPSRPQGTRRVHERATARQVDERHGIPRTKRDAQVREQRRLEARILTTIL